MPETDQHELKFSPVESDDLAQYRSVSRKAIGAVVMGILSVTSLFNPLMAWTSIVGVVLAVGAIRSVRASHGEIIGYKAAVLGLILSLFFGFWSPTAFVLRQQFIFAQAREHSREWLDLVRVGDLQPAHQLLRPQPERQLPTQNLADYYRENPAAQEDLERRFNEPPLKEIVAIGIDGPLRFVDNLGIRLEVRSAGTIEIVILRYAIDHFVNGQSKVLEFAIEMERQYIPKSGETRWYVRDVIDLARVRL